MPISTFDGKRIREARELRGLSITELANRTGIHKQSISAYECGQNSPDYERTCRMAAALDLPISFFESSTPCAVQTPVTFFRSKASATRTVRKQQSKALEYIARIVYALDNYIDFPTANIPEVEFESGFDIYNISESEEKLREIEYVADEMRKRWNLGNGPLTDIQYILESNGFIVCGLDTETDTVDGFSQCSVVREDKRICLIAVDQGRKPVVRIRFDLCHELGHMLLHPTDLPTDDLSTDEFKQRELEANMFASAFLLPRETFGNEIRMFPIDLNYYLELKKKWGVSVQAMVVRAYRLGCITFNQYSNLFRQINRKGWRQHEPGDEIGILGETMVHSAVDLILNNHVLSKQGLLDLFAQYDVSFYPAEIEKLLQLEPGTLDAAPEASARVIQLKSKIPEPDSEE